MDRARIRGPKLPPRLFEHPLSPISKRAAYATLAILLVMTIGTVGMRALTGWGWIDSFYFMAMLATAQGPSTAPPSFWAKIFAAFMAFVSVGTLITAVGVIFGPFLGYVFHKGVMFAEKEIEREKEKSNETKTKDKELGK
ncbi:MAG TPA: hypothetical protein VFF30_05105 [Nitrososphaerales archaeon]|nr:hypothetical protein [Nitrososphaerales archaeon]